MRRTWAGLVAGILATACMTGPRPIKSSPGDYLSANAPGRAWVVLKDGERMVVDGPRVISDTVFGWSEGDEISIPVADLEEVRVRQLSIFRTAIIPTILTGVTVAAIALTTSTTQTHDPDTDSTVDLRSMPRP